MHKIYEVNGKPLHIKKARKFINKYKKDTALDIHEDRFLANYLPVEFEVINLNSKEDTIVGDFTLAIPKTTMLEYDVFASDSKNTKGFSVRNNIWENAIENAIRDILNEQISGNIKIRRICGGMNFERANNNNQVKFGFTYTIIIEA